jgi:hypothetical protein
MATHGRSSSLVAGSPGTVADLLWTRTGFTRSSSGTTSSSRKPTSEDRRSWFLLTTVTATVAWEVTTLDQLTGGRMVLGVGLDVCSGRRVWKLR